MMRPPNAHGAEHLAHQRGGPSKAASLLLSPPSPPRNSEPLELLRTKHPKESQDSILAPRRDSTARLNQPPPGASWIQEVEDSFSTESASAAIAAEGTQRAV